MLIPTLLGARLYRRFTDTDFRGIVIDLLSASGAILVAALGFGALLKDPGEVTLGGIRVLFTAAQIAARVGALAAEIARTIPGEFVIVGLLKGAAVFVADLARALDRAGARPEIEFMRLASYGLGTESSGAVQLLGDVPAGLAGRRVLLVDDIVDTGRSIAYAVAELHRRGIGELWTCVLLDKPQRRQIEIAIDFVVLKRPAGRPPQEVRRYFASFSYEAQSWKKPRRVVAKVEWHPAELYPRVGFIVTNLARPAERVVGFYNQRGTAEQWIKEGKGAIKWTRLSCRTFAANAVRLQLHALA